MKDNHGLVVEQCKGCTNVINDNVCKVYVFPASKWSRSSKSCPMATHIIKKIVEDKFINPLKASKRIVKAKNKSKAKGKKIK